MHTDRDGFGRERRRRFGGVSSLFLSRDGRRRERKGKQDKGSVPRPCISLCLHILFSRDSKLLLRDISGMNGGDPRVYGPDHEMGGHRYA